MLGLFPIELFHVGTFFHGAIVLLLLSLNLARLSWTHKMKVETTNWIFPSSLKNLSTVKAFFLSNAFD